MDRCYLFSAAIPLIDRLLLSLYVDQIWPHPFINDPSFDLGLDDPVAAS